MKAQHLQGTGLDNSCLSAREVTAERTGAALEPLPAVGGAEGVTKPQPLTHCSYFGDSDLNEESPRGSHTYPSSPFTCFSSSPTPNLELKLLREQETAGRVALT